MKFLMNPPGDIQYITLIFSNVRLFFHESNSNIEQKIILKDYPIWSYKKEQYSHAT